MRMPVEFAKTVTASKVRPFFQSRFFKVTAPLAVSLLVGAFWFLCINNYYPLVFSHLGFIFNSGGDPLQYWLGWQFFRNEPWSFPVLGSITTYGYPIGSSITYTASIPLLAIPLKLLSPLLQNRFQYEGLWVAICYILQALFTILIVQEYTRNWICKILAASLLILSPIMLYRQFGHNPLAGQWLILAAIYLVMLGRRVVVPWWAWASLISLSVMVLPYFTLMVFPFLLVGGLEQYLKTRRLIPVLVLCSASLVAAAFTAYVVGVFSVPGVAGMDNGFGLYSFNLNGFFNSFGLSRLLPALPRYYPVWQGEGFAYLGLGIFFLLIVIPLISIRNGNIREFLWRNKFFLLLGCLFTILAASFRVTWNDRLLFEYHWPESIYHYLGIFRSSGRLIWPVVYLIVLALIIKTVQLRRAAPVILAAAVLIQYYDLEPWLTGLKLKGFTQYQSPLQSEFWSAAPEAFKHLVLLPAVPNLLYSMYEPYAIYAATNQLTLNYGYFARFDEKQFVAEGDKMASALIAGKADPASIYVMCRVNLIKEVEKQNPTDYIAFYNFDGRLVALSKANPLLQKPPSWQEQPLTAQQIEDYSLASLLAHGSDQQIFIISAKSSQIGLADPHTADVLRQYGLLSIKPQVNYVAILGKPIGKASLERTGEGKVQASLKVNDQLGNLTLPASIDVTSSTGTDGNLSSIVINGAEVSPNKWGLNVVAYDLTTGATKQYIFYRFYQEVCP